MTTRVPSEDEPTTSPSSLTNTGTVTPQRQPLVKAPKENRACLIILHGGELGRKISLQKQVTQIGRSSKAGVSLDHDSVSRLHCKITRSGTRYILRDLGSTNGTIVNDALVDEITLSDQDLIRVGRTILKFITGDNVESQYHEEIYRLMTVDGLTNTYNRRHFEELLEREIARSERYGHPFSLIALDLDHFKKVNDEWGHLAGDTVLRDTCDIITSRLRKNDTLARTGGEEFGIFLPESTLDQGLEAAEKLREAIANTPIQVEDRHIQITASFGVVSWKKGIGSIQELMKQADQQLYLAKDRGRNRVEPTRPRRNLDE